MEINKKMNRLYELGSALDGIYDGEMIILSQKRRYFNRFVELLAYFFFANHLIVFISDDPVLKKNLVHMKLNDGFLSRFISLFLGIGLFTINVPPILVYSKITEKPLSFRFGFWFCSDEKTMQEKYQLNEKLAKNQVKIQIFLCKLGRLWYFFYLLSLTLIISKFAYDDLSKQAFDSLFVFKLISYILLIFLYQTSMIRGYLMLVEQNIGAFYL